MSTLGIGRQNKIHTVGFDAPQCRSTEQFLAYGFFGARNICKTKVPQQSFIATQPNKLWSCFKELSCQFGFKIMIQHVQVGSWVREAQLIQELGFFKLVS